MSDGLAKELAVAEQGLSVMMAGDASKNVIVGTAMAAPAESAMRDDWTAL